MILEGNLVNLDVTSPGATLALALMYLKTNDAAVAAAFAVPDTHFALDYVKPEFLQLRVLARGLVMWDSVQPTKEWVESQLPDIIKVIGSPQCGILAARRFVFRCCKDWTADPSPNMTSLQLKMQILDRHCTPFMHARCHPWRGCDNSGMPIPTSYILQWSGHAVGQMVGIP